MFEVLQVGADDFGMPVYFLAVISDVFCLKFEV